MATAVQPDVDWDAIFLLAIEAGDILSAEELAAEVGLTLEQAEALAGLVPPWERYKKRGR